jgi:hypothetical protein
MAAGTTQIAVAAAILCRVADAPVRRNDTKRINGAAAYSEHHKCRLGQDAYAADPSPQKAANDCLARHN